MLDITGIQFFCEVSVPVKRGSGRRSKKKKEKNPLKENHLDGNGMVLPGMGCGFCIRTGGILNGERRDET